jgi:hypothetical protein
MITARPYRPVLDESGLNIIRFTSRNRRVSNTTKVIYLQSYMVY